MRKTLCDKLLNFDKFRASVRYELTMRNWTYKGLSARTGYSVSYITNLMRGNGSKRAAKEIAKALNIDIKQFK